MKMYQFMGTWTSVRGEIFVSFGGQRTINLTTMSILKFDIKENYESFPDDWEKI